MLTRLLKTLGLSRAGTASAGTGGRDLEQSRRYLLVDPIFRGSRLFYTWMADGALNAGAPNHIISRTQARTDHFHELFGDKSPEVFEVAEVPEDFWFGRIPDDQLKKMLAMMSELDARHNYAGIYFAGVTELYPAIFELYAEHASDALKSKPTIFVEYDGRFLIDSEYQQAPDGMKRGFDRRAGFYKTLFEAAPNAQAAVLDERAFREGNARQVDPGKFFFLPDPLPDSRSETIAESHTGEDDFVTAEDKVKLLLVGRQSSRKGLRDIINVAKTYEAADEEPDVLFFLSGALEDEVAELKPGLQRLNPYIHWRDAYVSEKQIRDSYAAADYVVLPYTKGFSGSSGVLAFAAAFGTPIVATEHGCIGYRVKNFGLGLTYPSGDKDALAAVLKSLPKPGSADYEALKSNCLAYAKRNSIKAHQRTLAAQFSSASELQES